MERKRRSSIALGGRGLRRRALPWWVAGATLAAGAIGATLGASWVARGPVERAQGAANAAFALVVVLFTAVATLLVTRRRRPRSALRTANAVLITDEDGRVAWANDGLLALCGCTREALIGRAPHELQVLGGLPPDDARAVIASLEGRRPFRGEIEVKGRAGERRWLDLEIEPLDDDGPPGASLLAIDVTERKAALARSESAKREVESLLSTIRQHAIYSVADRQGDIVDVNDAFCELTGYAREELIGKNHRILNSGVHPRRFFTEMWRTIAAGRSWRNEMCNRAKDGTMHWVDTIVAPQLAPDGSVERFIVIRSDTTARKRTEERLREARNAAEQASVAKSRFLANMSHEIRTPMNGMLGMLGFLARSALDASQRDYVNKAQRAARGLLGVINDILDFSKIEAGKLELDPHPFDLPDLLKDLWAVLQAGAADKPVGVRFDLEPALPRGVVGDALRLQQVLLNLGGNAIKFTQQGEVVVRVAVVEAAEGRVRLRFAVEDSGIGIAEEHQKRIFEGFSQAETSTTRRFGGTGLGLAISRHLIQLMGGELTLESRLGVGSTFGFELGFELSDALPEPAPASSPTPPAGARLAGLNLLVVEDNALNREVASGLLEAEGARVTVAINGKRGVEAIALAPEPFDLVLMDVQMPVMDGYEATKEIRWTLGMGRLPIVAMTANALPADRAACLAAGMDDHIGKPLELNRLLQTICRHIASAQQPLEVAAEATPEACSVSPAVRDEAKRLGVDLSTALERIDGNVGLYVRLVRSFAREAPTFVTALEHGLAGPREDARRAMHTLKGLAGTLGLNELSTLAREAEQRLASPSDDEEGDLVAAVGAAVDATVTKLVALSRTLEAEPAHRVSVAPEGPAANDAIERRLEELAALLASSDLRALDVYEQLHREHAALRGELDPLGEAVSALNFGEGVTRCEALLRRLGS